MSRWSQSTGTALYESKERSWDIDTFKSSSDPLFNYVKLTRHKTQKGESTLLFQSSSSSFFCCYSWLILKKEMKLKSCLESTSSFKKKKEKHITSVLGRSHCVSHVYIMVHRITQAFNMHAEQDLWSVHSTAHEMLWTELPSNTVVSMANAHKAGFDSF